MPTEPRRSAFSMGYGIDQIVQGACELPRLGRYGLLTNDAAVTASDSTMRSREALLRAGINLVRLFSPEHGLSAAEPDGAPVPHGRDLLTELEVISLYGRQTGPTPSTLSDLDGMLIDLPDIGTRSYTFIWTMSVMLEACAEAKLPLWILDRPNPIGGDLGMAEGPLLDEASCSSFLGRFAIPIRHSLTMGELARLWNYERGLKAELCIIPATGWRRTDHHPQTGLPFAPPSPGIPSYISALLYPALCFFEATNLSVGRGTSHPFQQIGAPWLDVARLQKEFIDLQLPGITSVTNIFTPNVGPYQNELCKGLRLQVIDPTTFRPVTMGLMLLSLVIRLSANHFLWANYPTAANPSGERHFERLIGRQGFDTILQSCDEEIATRVESWTAVPEWAARVAAHLCYE